jgi:predicted molibdopterin-dependent oxidoreductase YjgC
MVVGEETRVINLTIDEQQVKVKEGATVLEAARQAGIYIPTLCYHPSLTPYGACRLCIVEIENLYYASNRRDGGTNPYTTASGIKTQHF